MTSAQIISTIIFFLMPGSVGAVYYLCRSFAQRLPDQQRLALEQFARLAVQKVEQQYTNNPEKKSLAESFVIAMFKAFNLPIPPKEAIDIAIEASVYLLGQMSTSDNTPLTGK
jgi:hypothetical protein